MVEVLKRARGFLDGVDASLKRTQKRRENALGKIGSQSAGGLDGWKPHNIRNLPDKILQLLLPMYALIEKFGTWPDILCWAGITLIPKGEGGDPLSLRPITVTSVIYRIWAAAKMRQSIEWQESWIRKGQHGARAKHSTVNDLLQLSLVFEEAILDGKPMNGVAIDLAKAFDNVPVDIVFKVCEEMGMDKGLWSALRGMYRQIRRRFKIGSYVGQDFKDTNGILQGCPLSVMLLNVLMAILTIQVEGFVEAESYVDDLNILPGSQGRLQRALDLVDEFMRFTGQKINEKKTKSFGLHGGLDLLLAGKLLQKVDSVKVLGVVLAFRDGRVAFQVSDDKVDEAVSLCNRIRYSGMPFHIRQTLVGTLVMSRVMYGVEILDLQLSQERKLRTAIGYAIWKKSSKQRSLGLLFTLVTKGHVTDPAQAPHVRRLQALWRCTVNDETLQARILNVWAKNSRKRRFRGGGFVENLIYSTQRLGIKVEFQRDGLLGLYFPISGENLKLAEVRSQTWGHAARDMARQFVWRQLEKERAREGRVRWGISDGICTNSTMRLYRSSNARAQGVLRKILLNAVWTNQKRAKMPDASDGPACDCGYVLEDLCHLWWHCPRWRDVRVQYGLDSFAYDGFPIATRDLGIAIDGHECDIENIQRMMMHIFTKRYAGLGPSP